MHQLLQGLKCSFEQPVKIVCLSDDCNVSPFLCSESCPCYGRHPATCKIRAIQELAEDILKVSRFENLVVYSPELKGSSIQVMGRHAEQSLSKVRNQQIAMTLDPLSADS
jgi:hypothetical protein